MRTAMRLTLGGGFLAAAALAMPTPVHAQHSGVEIWAAVCGRCHTIQPPNRYSAKDWTSILSHMAVNARLTGDQKEAILAFLIQGAMRPEPDPVPAATMEATLPISLFQGGAGLLQPLMPQGITGPEEDFKSLCAPCHGEGGKGDGPAAAGFNPKPADFTNPALWADRTDDSLAESIASGIRMMPAFGTQLKPEQIRALVKYIRSLSEPGK